MPGTGLGAGRTYMKKLDRVSVLTGLNALEQVSQATNKNTDEKEMDSVEE